MFLLRIFPLLLLFALFWAGSVAAGEKHSAIQDSLTLRRIVEYWKEGDTAAVKLRIRDFLATHADHAYADQLYAMLGDVYFQEKNFTEAAAAYREIHGKEFQEKTLYHKVHCLHETGQYADVISSAKLFLKSGHAPKEQETTIRFEMAEAYYRLGRKTDHLAAKETLFKEALAHYQVLSQTLYADLTLAPLSEIYVYFKEDERAVNVFLKLAEKDLEKREEYLFQAATRQLNYDHAQAIETYAKIYRLNGSYASQAAFNQMNLLFHAQRYRDLLLVQEEALQHVCAEQMPLMHYYIGKSLCALGDYARAIVPLKLCAASPTVDPAQVKSALLSLIACAREVHDLGLFDQALAHLKNGYGKDEDTVKALLLHSQICKEQELFKRAQEDLKEVLTLVPQHPQKEAILYDQAVLLSQSDAYAEAVRAFQEFLKQYPNSLKKGAAWRHLAFCQIEDARSASSGTERIKKQELLQVLADSLTQSKLFSHTERQQIHYLLGKTYYEMGHYDEALDCLAEYVSSYAKDAHCVTAHLMMAECHLKGSQDLHLFTIDAEKALALDPDLPEKGALHLQLYNAYLTLAQTEQNLIVQAADHLFWALDQPMKRENQLWLAHYYYRQVPQVSAEMRPLYFQRAVTVLEKLLGVSEERFKLAITPHCLDMEGEVIKLGDLYAQAHRYKDKTRLLHALKESQERHPDWGWKYTRLVLFELGKSYEELGETQKALQAYDFLIHSSSHTSSYFGTAARLQKARLQYALLPSGQEHLPAVHVILDSLKDLQIQRKLVSEPVHLEAALSYIEIRASLAPPEEKAERALALIRQARESFTALEDPLVKHYFSAKERFSDQLRLFHQYMQFLSAEEFRVEAGIAFKNHEIFRAKEFKMKALVQLDALMKEDLHEALHKRIQDSREALNRDL